jgi:hypothetical protein
VIDLSASGKTARSFTEALIYDRKPGEGPLGLLAITSRADNELVPEASFPTKTISYNDIDDPTTMDWLVNLQASEILICDFGARGNSYFTLLESLTHDFGDKFPIVTVGVGAEPKPTTDLSEVRERMAKLTAVKNRFQMNTSPVQDVALRLRGEDEYFEELERAWEDRVRRGTLMKGLRMEWGSEIEGRDGVEGGWDKVCHGEVESDVGLVYMM